MCKRKRLKNNHFHIPDGLINLYDLKFSRCCKGSRVATDMQLHAFADASTVARGAVCYVQRLKSTVLC